VRVEVEHLPQSQVQLQIEIDPEMLGQAYDKAFQRLAGRYRVPGFRPGKAPRAVLERALGAETLLSEAADICMNDAYAQAIKENDLQPIGYPDVQSPKTEEIAPGKPLSFTATVYVRPQVQLGDYRALRIPLVVPTIGMEQVDQVLESYRSQQAPLEPLAEDQQAENGDTAALRLLATVGDETLIDQEAFELTINTDESPTLPIPGLSSRLVGMRVGEIKDETIDLPEDYIPAEHAGKQMDLHIEVLRLERKVLPPLDDTFAASLGSFETLDQLRAALQQQMQSQAQREAMEAYVDNVVRQVVDQATVDVPPPMVHDEVHEMMHQLQETVERDRKISMDTYTRVVGKSVEELEEEARPAAEQRVRSDLVLEAVADAEQVSVPEEQVEDQVTRVAGSPTLSNKERRRLLGSQDLRQRIRRRLRRDLAITRLLEITRPPEPEPSAEAPAAIEGEIAPAAEVNAAAATVAAPETSEAATLEASSEAEQPSVQQNEQES
jgi:trigger factor